MKNIVLVTGASSGIGMAAARLLASSGFHVLAGVRKVSDAVAWADVRGVEPVVLDVTSDESVRTAVASIRHRLEAADVVHLVNNAGIAVGGPVEGVDLGKWKEQFEVNLFGLVRVTQAMLPWVRRTKGRVLNVSSVSGLATTPYLGPYSASKFAVEALSDALRREIGQFGCQVVVVEPGPTITPIWEKSVQAKPKLSKDLEEVYGKDLEAVELDVERTSRGAAPVDRVARVILAALTARVPRTRYVVGARGLALQMRIVGWLPDRWLDALMDRNLRR